MAGNIQQYTSPIDQLHPDSNGDLALARAARGIGAEYHQMGQDYEQAIDRGLGPEAKQIDQHEAMSEISQGSAALAAIHNNFTTQWNQMASKTDPNDTSIQGKFLNDNVEPTLQKFQEGFNTEAGQKWGQDRANELRMHYTEKTAADMSTRAGNATVENAKTTLNQLSTAAYRDPSSMDASMGQIDALVAAAKEHNTGNLTPEQINKLGDLSVDAKNEIVKSGLKGLADGTPGAGNGNPKAVIQAVESGKFDDYLKPGEAGTLIRYAQHQDDTQGVEREHQAQVVQAQKTAANSQEVQGIFSSLASGKGYPATLAFANVKLTTQQKNDLVAKNDGILTLPQDFLTSPKYGDNFGQIAQSVYEGQPISAAALTAGVRRQEITPAGAAQLQALSDKMRTPEGLAETNAQSQVLQQMRSQIVKGGPNAFDPKGETIYNNMLNSFYSAWDAGIKSGKSPAELADPESKSYIGNIASTFKRSDTQAIADVTTPRAPAASIPPADKREINKAYTNQNGVSMWWTDKGWSKTAPTVVPKPE